MCFLRFFFIVVISFSLHALLPLLANNDEYNINIVRTCQDHFSFHHPSVLLAKRVAKFELRLTCFSLIFQIVNFLQFTLLCSFYRILVKKYFHIDIDMCTRSS